MKTPFELYDFFQISIIQDGIDNVSKNLNMILKCFNFTQEELKNVDFSAVCSNRNLPSTTEVIKFILFEPSTNPGQTVFFTSLRDGWHTAIYNYTRLYKKNAFQAGFTNDTENESPAYFFHFFYISKGNIAQRTVHAIKEDKWVFYEQNTPLDIEDTSNYSKRRIKDRINNDVILDYLAKAGYDLRDKRFYISPKRTLKFTFNQPINGR